MSSYWTPVYPPFIEEFGVLLYVYVFCVEEYDVNS